MNAMHAGWTYGGCRRNSSSMTAYTNATEYSPLGQGCGRTCLSLASESTWIFHMPCHSFAAYLQKNSAHLKKPDCLAGLPVPSLLRPLFPAQENMASGCAASLDLHGGVLEIADCGAGKTSVAIGTILAHARGKPFTSVVMCPGHVVGTWIQEVVDVCGMKAREIASWREALQFEIQPGWYVIGRDRAKLWPGKAELSRCPQCFKPADGQTCECGSPLWSWAPTPRRWPIASILRKRMMGRLDYFVGDEAHELASDAQQGHAMGQLISTAKSTILLTATPTGGKAEELRTILFRLFPREMKGLGFGWSDKTKFSKRYGRIEVDKRKGRARRSVVPGIMPNLYADLLIHHSAYLRLEDLSDNLPPYTEITTPVGMGKALSKAYSTLERALGEEVRELLKRRQRSLMGPMLAALLCYPDAPTGWGTIGYKEAGRFVGVARPEDVAGAMAKEKELLRILKEERGQGRQVWVYVQYKRVGARLEEMLKSHDYQARLLKASDAKPRDRKAWIAAHAPGLDVMISHSKLVQTGIDLFDKKNWTFNFPSLVFYEAGLIPNELRQAAGRGRRIGQTQPCTTRYLCYAGTLQERLLKLMSSKIGAAQVLEGKAVIEGLACMEDGVMEELARGLLEAIDVAR